MEEREAESTTSMSTIGLPREIFIPSNVAREIQKAAKCSLKGKGTMATQSHLHSRQDYAISHQAFDDVVIERLSRRMSNPIPIPRNFDDSHSQEERQLLFEQQQLRDMYNSATWRLYHYIRDAQMAVQIRNGEYGVSIRQDEEEEILAYSDDYSKESRSATQSQGTMHNAQQREQTRDEKGEILEEMSKSRNDSGSGPFCCIFEMDW